MNAADKAKAAELAARRLQDETDRVIEAVGALLAKRAQCAAKATDLLFEDLRIATLDYGPLADCAAAYALDNEDPDRIKAAFLTVMRKAIDENRSNMSVHDFACELVAVLYPEGPAQ